MAQVDSTGVRPFTVEEYVQLLAAAWAQVFPNIDLSPQTPAAQVIGGMAQVLAERDQELVALNSGLSIETAAGRQLDNLAIQLGLVRTAGESDDALRRRYRAQRGANETGTREGLERRLLALDGVTECLIYENTTSAEVVTRGLTIGAHSFTAVIRGGADADIAQVINDHKPMGIGTSGSSSAAVVNADGVTATMRWEPVVTMPIVAAVALNTEDGFPADGGTLVGNALHDYFAELDPGELHDAARASAVMYNAAPGFTLTSAAYTQADSSAIPSSLDANRQLDLPPASITVTLTSS